jgi:hypothetical protein
MAISLKKLPKLSADNDVRRNLLLFQGYCQGRMTALTMQLEEHPAEKGECEAAMSEIAYIYNEILPHLLKSAS